MSEGRHATLRRGQRYHLKDGTAYRCKHAVPGDSLRGILPMAELESVQTGWEFTAVGTRKHPDGSISWDWSTGGKFKEQL